MTLAQARATGLLRDEEPMELASRPGCRSVQGLHGITTVMIGPRGVEYVEVYPFIATAEGVAVGDRIADARRAYPTLSVPDDWQLGTVVSVPVPGASGAHYTITIDVKGDVAGSDPDDALVSRLALVSDTAGCSRS